MTLTTLFETKTKPSNLVWRKRGETIEKTVDRPVAVKQKRKMKPS